MLTNVVIRRPSAQRARACVQIDKVKIVSIDCVLTRNIAHQTAEACGKGFEAPADLEDTRKRIGRGSIHKSRVVYSRSNKVTFYQL